MEKFRFFDRDMLFLIIFGVALFSGYFLAPAMAGREMSRPPATPSVIISVARIS